MTVVLERLLELASRVITLELAPEKFEESLLLDLDFAMFPVIDMVSTARGLDGCVCSSRDSIARSRDEVCCCIVHLTNLLDVVEEFFACS